MASCPKSTETNVKGTQGPNIGQSENQKLNNDGLKYTAYLKIIS